MGASSVASFCEWNQELAPLGRSCEGHFDEDLSTSRISTKGCLTKASLMGGSSTK